MEEPRILLLPPQKIIIRPQNILPKIDLTFFNQEVGPATMGACASKDGIQHGVNNKNIPAGPRVIVAKPKTPTSIDTPKKIDESDQDVRLDEDDEMWFDESEGSVDELPPPKPIPASAASRRRRLSVSTVEGGKMNNQENKPKIIKFDDPAMELVDRENGLIRPVTLDMLEQLFPESKHCLNFGSPSFNIQRGFDNKVIETGGYLPGGKTWTDMGIGYACKKGLKPESPNQDDYFVLRVDDWCIYGVFDGHGPYGHDISAFVHKTLPFLIISDPEFETNVASTLRKAFKKVQQLVEAISDQPGGKTFDASLSGTTATIAVHRKNKLTMAHVGDSMAVVGTKTNGKWGVHELTVDHKPMNKGEKERIEKSGGQVKKLEGDIPHRVFVKNKMYPGLAMSRAIGDLVGASVGVIAEPEISCYELTEEDATLIIATDGVWEFISGQEAVDITKPYPRNQVHQAVEALSYESWRRWVEEEENVVDDVTCLVIWLEDQEGVSREH